MDTPFFFAFLCTKNGVSKLLQRIAKHKTQAHRPCFSKLFSNPKRGTLRVKTENKKQKKHTNADDTSVYLSFYYM